MIHLRILQNQSIFAIVCFFLSFCFQFESITALSCEEEIEWRISQFLQTHHNNNAQLVFSEYSGATKCADTNDLRRLLKDADVQWSCQWPGQVLKRFDSNSDDCIDEQEFVAAQTTWESKVSTDESAVAVDHVHRHQQQQQRDPNATCPAYPSAYNSSSNAHTSLLLDKLKTRYDNYQENKTRHTQGMKQLINGLEELGVASDHLFLIVVDKLNLSTKADSENSIDFDTIDLEAIALESPVLVKLRQMNGETYPASKQRSQEPDRRRATSRKASEMDRMLARFEAEQSYREKRKKQSRRKGQRFKRLDRVLERRSAFGVVSKHPEMMQRRSEFANLAPAVNSLQSLLMDDHHQDNEDNDIIIDNVNDVNKNDASNKRLQSLRDKLVNLKHRQQLSP